MEGKQMSDESSLPRVLSILSLLFILNSCATVFILPALPQLADYFKVGASYGQLTVPCLLAGVILSVIFMGHLSDKIGKILMLKVLLPIFIVGALTCAVAPNIWIVLLGRFIQGFGLGSALPLGQAILADIFDKKALTKKISYLFFSITWIIALSSTIGGYVAHHLNWHYNFLFLAAYALLLYPLLWLIPKTQQANPLNKATSKKHLSLVTSYKQILSNRQYLRLTLCYAFIAAGLPVFYAISPFLIIHELHISPKEFGTLMFIPIIGLMLGRLVSGLASHKNPQTMIYIGLIFTFLGATMMFWEGFAPIAQAIIIMLAMSLFTFGLGIISPNANAGAIKIIPALVATAATLLSLIVNLISAANSFILARYFETFLAEGLFALSVIALTVFVVLGWKTTTKSHAIAETRKPK
jgi:MFS transporter, DHA1 family, 2-module integral membrane pump EmrD